MIGDISPKGLSPPFREMIFNDMIYQKELSKLLQWNLGMKCKGFPMILAIMYLHFNILFMNYKHNCYIPWTMTCICSWN